MCLYTHTQICTYTHVKLEVALLYTLRGVSGQHFSLPATANMAIFLSASQRTDSLKIFQYGVKNHIFICMLSELTLYASDAVFLPD